jgi:hypothetical protein
LYPPLPSHCLSSLSLLPCSSFLVSLAHIFLVVTGSKFSLGSYCCLFLKCLSN